MYFLIKNKHFESKTKKVIAGVLARHRSNVHPYVSQFINILTGLFIWSTRER